MSSHTLSFSKYHGTGNDFIMVDNRQITFDPTTEQIAFLCDRHFGIGADGLIMIEPHPELAFTMRYFNADGKESTMCGNGGRCAVAFATSLGMVDGTEVSFMAADGPHTALILQDAIRLKMQDVTAIEEHSGYLLADTGSPHYVTFQENVPEIDVVNRGKEIRYARTFQPGGVNVNFVEINEQGIIVNRTYERGVENETLSCGTGSVAAAVATALHYQPDSEKMIVRTLGGELTVRYHHQPGSGFTDVWLEGPAIFVFSGTIIIP